jgi:uncharacterized protein
MRNVSHPVVHFEIRGTDGPKLHAYYANLFGWKVNAENAMQYGLVAAEQGGIGGGISGSGRPGVTIYIEVPDLQGMLDKAVALGGRVVTPVTHIPNMVTFAEFQDPQGNLIGLVQSDTR